MLLIILLIAGTLSRPGISGEEAYFAWNFPSFARNLDSFYAPRSSSSRSAR